MKTIETITANTMAVLDDIAPVLAQNYIDAFARPPWNEVSRCPKCGGFSGLGIGTMCPVCSTVQDPAYAPDQLYGQWRDLLNQGAMMEVQSQDGAPRRVTIAGLTDPVELYARKYQDIPAMEAWLSANLPERFAYIYETFTDLSKQPKGNLSDRGQTLGRISAAFAGLPIVTRTVQPAVVRATVRDMGALTDVYIGEKDACAAQAMGARAIFAVPDWRTVLVVGAER